MSAPWRWREPPVEGMPHGYSLAAGRWVPWLDSALALAEAPLANTFLRGAPDRPIFLVGAFRSGTTLVERILCRHPDVASFCYFSNQFIRAPVLGAWGIRLLARMGVLDLGLRGFIHNPKLPSNLFSSFECEWIYSQCGRNLWGTSAESIELDARFEHPAFEKYLVSVMRRHLWLFGKRRFVNKNPYNSLRVGFLGRLFPDALFVRVLRHPLATIDSHLRTQRKLERALAAVPRGSYIYRDGLHMDVLSAPAKTACYAELRALEDEDRRLALAGQWRDFQAAIDRALQQDASLRARVCDVRYEQLVDDPRRCIADLLEWTGLGSDSSDALDAGIASIQAEQTDPERLTEAFGPVYGRVCELIRAPAESLGYKLPR